MRHKSKAIGLAVHSAHSVPRHNGGILVNLTTIKSPPATTPCLAATETHCERQIRKAAAKHNTEVGCTLDQGRGDELATIDMFGRGSKCMEDKALSSFLRTANMSLAYFVLWLRCPEKQTTCCPFTIKLLQIVAHYC